jgi:hypothetical protein
MKHLKLLFLITSICSAQVSASMPQYECEILSHSNLQNDGSLDKHQKSNDFDKNLVGTKFVVDRKTGDVKGDVYFSNNYKKKLFFIEDGNSKRAFRAIWIQKSNQYTSFSGVVYIQIFTPVDEIKKPFIVNSGTSVMTGVCK